MSINDFYLVCRVNCFFNSIKKNRSNNFWHMQSKQKIDKANVCSLSCFFLSFGVNMILAAHSKTQLFWVSFLALFLSISTSLEIYIFISLLLINFKFLLSFFAEWVCVSGNLHSTCRLATFDSSVCAGVRLDLSLSLAATFLFIFALWRVPLFSLYSCHLKT